MSEFDKAVRDVKSALMEITSVNENDYQRRNQIANDYAPRVVNQIIEAVIERIEAIDRFIVTGR